LNISGASINFHMSCHSNESAICTTAVLPNVNRYYIQITFHFTTVVIKNLSLMNLHNLCFSVWYHYMLQSYQIIYSNSTGLLMYVLL
jgi:hypothetical protein